MKYNSKIIILVIILLYILYYNIENYETTLKSRTLEKDGFMTFYNPNYSEETHHYPSDQLKKDVLKVLPPGYIFIDYVYKINNGSLSTFHRDVTSSKNIFGTKHTVYTLILYKYNGDFLSVCPGSNKTYPFVWSKIVNIHGKSGTAFLFDCDLLHAGQMSQCKERKVIQYKLCHIDDLDKLKSLQNVYVKKNNNNCSDNIYNKLKRKCSYFFEMPINYFAYPLMIKRENPNSFVGMIQSFIPLNFYNNV
jgi:hypothetical protein